MAEGEAIRVWVLVEPHRDTFPEPNSAPELREFQAVDIFKFAQH